MSESLPYTEQFIANNIHVIKPPTVPHNIDTIQQRKQNQLKGVFYRDHTEFISSHFQSVQIT